MAAPLSESDAKAIRNVVTFSVGSSMSFPTATRTPVAAKVRDGVLRLRVRGGAGTDSVPAQIADQVLVPGWAELPSAYPLERVFQGHPRATSDAG
jgi:hypothetical protein